MRHIVFAVLLYAAAALLKLSAAGSWSYEKQEDWPGVCQTGKHQSPIDIRSGDAERVNMTEVRFYHYDSTGSFHVTATGKTVRVHGFMNWKKRIPYIEEGGLDGRYYLEEVQFHWYRKNEQPGSEHSIDGTHYPIEIQMVHRGKIDGRKRIAVLAAFVKPYEPEPNEEASDNGLDSLLMMIAGTDRVTPSLPGNNRTTHSFAGGAEKVLYPKHLLPANRSRFYRYEGSLTEPGCDENVTWTVMEAPLEIPEELTARLTNLRNAPPNGPTEFVHNQRRQQDLNGRLVILRDPTSTKTEPTKKNSGSAARRCCVFWPLATAIVALMIVDVKIPDGIFF